MINMSVKTTADEKIDEAKEHIDSAYKLLLVVLDVDTWGSSRFNTYINNIEKL